MIKSVTFVRVVDVFTVKVYSSSFSCSYSFSLSTVRPALLVEVGAVGRCDLLVN